MTGGMSMFQSELRTAVREARATPAVQAAAKPAPRLVSRSPQGELTEAYPRTPSPAEKRTVVKLWLPLTPLWILLAPFALLLAPLLLLAPRLLPDRPGSGVARAAFVVRPYRTAFALGAILMALSGTRVDVDTPDAVVRIRIF
jgi:hypothetical protein